MTKKEKELVSELINYCWAEEVSFFEEHFGISVDEVEKLDDPQYQGSIMVILMKLSKIVNK